MATASGADQRLTPGARRILDVASRLFYSRGLYAVGVDTIAAESGITKRTLYDRFGSKDALITAYLLERNRAWWEQAERRIEASGSPRTLALFDAYADEEWSTERGCAFLNAAADLPADHPGYAVVRQHKQAVRRRLAELVAADGATDGEELADHLFLLLEGAIAHCGIDGDSQLLDRARQLARDLLDRAVL